MPHPQSPVVDLVYFNAGGGHRASAQALQAVLNERRPHWRVRAVNLFEMLDPQGSFRRATGFAPEDVYNHRLKRGWTLGLAQELKLLQGMIRLAHPSLVRSLAQHWETTAPDLVVSLIPNFNRALAQGVATARPGVPFVTVLTDLADHPPNFWIEPGADQHLVCATAKALGQARSMGVPDARFHLSSGMIIRPEFYGAPMPDRDAELRRLGLDPARPTGIVLFGGQGSRAMATIARRLAQVQLIFICGHNAALARRIEALPAGAPRLVLGFTPDVAHYMRLADFFVGKPGPGSVSEALRCGLPVLVVRNAWTMPQERYNADWILEQRVGVVHDRYRSIDLAALRLLAQLDDLRRNVRRLDNRAVFEMVEILARLLDRRATPERSQAVEFA